MSLGSACPIRLRCWKCGQEDAPPSSLAGCSVCGSMLEVWYDYSGVAIELKARPESIWDFSPLLPNTPGPRITAGEGGSPLVEVVLGGFGATVKNEGINPTCSFKDRFNAVNTTVAKWLGFTSIVSATTGNAGLSAAFYAALAGLDALVFVSEETPEIIRNAIAACGGVVRVAHREDHTRLLHEAVAKGAFPATTATPFGAATPFGIEGYKTIAFEVVGALGRVPDRVYVPVGGGDALYGIAKGFRELVAVGLANRVPRMIGVQSAATNPLVQAYRSGGTSIPTVRRGRTIAYSINDATTGPHALQAIRETGGEAVSVSDTEIVNAIRALALQGVLAEPASAAAVAGWQQAVREGHLKAGEDSVCIVTGSLLKWPDVISKGW